MRRKMRITMMTSQISKTNTMIMNSLTTMMTTRIMMMITKIIKMMKMMKTTTITEAEEVLDKAVAINRETTRVDLHLAAAGAVREVIQVPGHEAAVPEADRVPDHQAEAGQETETELQAEALHR